jgi:hypothetical protein
MLNVDFSDERGGISLALWAEGTCGEGSALSMKNGEGM